MVLSNRSRQGFNLKAFLWSAGIHLLLLLLFLLLHYNIPATEVINDGGLEVNLGTSDQGSGKDQPMSRKKPAEYAASVVYKTKSEPADKIVPKDILKENNPDSPPIDSAIKTEKPVADAGKKQPEEKPKYLYPGDNGPGGNSANEDKKGSSEGITTGKGDQGVPSGTPGAANYSGTPGSGGISHTLTGRTISPDKFEADFNESGRVVIHVTVDRDGNIVSKMVKSASSAQLAKIALDKISKSKFSKSTSSEPQQFGDVIIEFKTR